MSPFSITATYRGAAIIIANISSTPIGWEGEGWAGSYKVVGKGYLFTKTSQTASTGAIFTSTYHTKQLNPWPNSSTICVVNYCRLSACQGDMQPFEGDPHIHGHLISLRNKPHQENPGQLSAPIYTYLNC